MARTRGRAKRRERPLGAAIGLGLAVTLGVALAILIVQLLFPHSFMRQYYDLLLHSPSATLPFSTLYQKLSEETAWEEALFATPFSLLCGGLVLGRCAPFYSPRRRVLISGAVMAFGILVVSLTFLWADNIYTTNLLNSHEGGSISHSTAPFAYVLRQGLCDFGWILACVLGTWLGLRWRDQRRSDSQGESAPPPTRSARREIAHR